MRYRKTTFELTVDRFQKLQAHIIVADRFVALKLYGFYLDISRLWYLTHPYPSHGIAISEFCFEARIAEAGPQANGEESARLQE